MSTPNPLASLVIGVLTGAGVGVLVSLGFVNARDAGRAGNSRRRRSHRWTSSIYFAAALAVLLVGLYVYDQARR